MKKLFTFFIMAIALCACSEDIKRNNVSVFQAVKNNEVWEGSDAKAAITGSTVTVQAFTFNETVTLKFPVPATAIDPLNKSTFVTHMLGVNNNATATYSLRGGPEELIFETGTNHGDGEIVVSKYNGASLSGTFKFNAHNTDATSNDSIVNFQKGVFYEVSIVPSL